MVKIKLASFVGGKGSVLLFDGDVLEILGEHTMRVHVSHTDKIGVKTDRGRHYLVMDYGSWPNVQVDEDAFSKVINLVTEIQKAKAAYSFD